MSENWEADLRAVIHVGMQVLGMDGGPLGQVFDVGDHAIALERGAFLPHEWTASLAEVERVDDRGVWLKHGTGSLERISDAFCGPIEQYRAAAEASPIHHWSGFRPPAVSHLETTEAPPSGSLPSSDARRPESRPAETPEGDDAPSRH